MQTDPAPIWETHPKLVRLPRYGWQLKKAWQRLRQAPKLPAPRAAPARATDTPVGGRSAARRAPDEVRCQ